MIPDEGKKNEACALITGASSGIGREYALLLAGRGFDLILVGNREEENRQVAREIAERYGVSVWPLYADLARPDAAERIHAETTARGWKVEVLVCNAGALRFGLLTNEAPEAVAGLVTLHCTTPALLCRRYGAEMRARGCGHILIMSSVTAWMPYPTVALYAATKSFLRSFARALHDEMHDVGVHVTAVFPGAVDTPLYRLECETGGAEVWIKLEGGNPGGSIKDRAAWGMLREAQKRGELTERSVIVEPTSGNTGIGLALLGRALGLFVVLTMPESMSVERRAVLSAFGAKLELTPAAEGMAGAVARAREILAGNPDAVMLDQFSNPGNPLAHEMTTGPEILAQLPEGKKLAAFVASFGTGGTVTGVARALRKKFPDVHVVAVEPASSPLVTQGRSGAHAIQGIGANFVPACLAVGEIDEFTAVTDDEAIETARRLASEFGLFSGISTGANVAAALKIAAKLPKDSAVVTIQPDRGDKYLSVFAR